MPVAKPGYFERAIRQFVALRVRRGSRRANNPWDYQELRTVPERRPRDLTSGGP